ncbi:transmembrane protein 183 [Condylostylus longicornis]|uniref:transmembrane protein 183 n=1 Tax=Condylostylus longicornis TaxID=2530218 RepID=UPI00244E4B6A|nr:transmembrane protein 183 [Condylostylus longicornis]
MPKKGCHHRHKIVPEGEVTIKDFADKATQGGRTKKVLNKSQQVTTILIQDILSMDINDDDDDDVERKKCGIKRKRKNKEMMDSNHIYNDYHIDIWFLISEHIKPEDTGRFALICKKTEAVVCSARYWSNLYKRYYNSRIVLPERLKPDRMDRVGGLRARVICSLFYTCPTFSLRLSKPDRYNLNRLEKLQCIEMWYRTVKEGTWMFCYRFSNRINVRKPILLKNYSSDDDGDDDDNDVLDRLENFLAEHNNIFENRYEGQHLLIITSDRFIPFPEIRIEGGESKITLGMIRQPLSKDLRHTGLEMCFVDYKKTPVARSYYEKILDYRTINWWDPEFWIFSDL